MCSRPITCSGRSTGVVCKGDNIEWAIHSVWVAPSWLFVAALVFNRSAETREAAARNVTLIDGNAMQYDAVAGFPYGPHGYAPEQWKTAQSSIFPHAIARVWIPVVWTDGAVPETMIWQLGGIQRVVGPVGPMNLVSTANQQILQIRWADLVKPLLTTV